jgi:hypothetical protein
MQAKARANPFTEERPKAVGDRRPSSALAFWTCVHYSTFDAHLARRAGLLGPGDHPGVTRRRGWLRQPGATGAPYCAPGMGQNGTQ